ncbi:MAG TPA: ATPase domain-containing protein [Longimicrobiaceae bacterium]|jgi:KaiC/GvpD/RAD55 family RecA-like ATPase|nr:ATPase domain-containing protein [Longimicrobiaceae bacterium]
MLSTGIEALDARLGGLVTGRYYLVSGGPGTGKSSVALQFVGAGLEAGERCAILTQDDPEDLVAQAEFLGYDFRAAALDDRLVILQYRLDFAHNFTRVSDPDRIARELRQMVGDEPVHRFVVDSLVPFVDGDGGGGDTAGALANLLETVGATTYLTVPGDTGDAHYWRIYDRVVTGAAGIFHLERTEGQARELSLRKLRQAAVSAEPFRFTLAAGVGIVEQAPPSSKRADLPPELQRRVVVLNTAARLPGELQDVLESAYDVRLYNTVESAFADLATGGFGALVVVLDPRDPDSAFSLVRQLRKLGNGAPILYVSSAHELRSSTRSRGLRVGGDDFVTDDLDPREFLERVEVARARGHRHGAAPVGAESIVLQPTDDDGRPLPVEEAELRRAVRHQVEHAPHPFFALVSLRPAKRELDRTWRVLCEQLRVREGDLVAKTEDGRVSVYLHDINRRHVKELLARIMASQPGLKGAEDPELYSYPVDRAEIEHWLARDGAPELAASRA